MQEAKHRLQVKVKEHATNLRDAGAKKWGKKDRDQRNKRSALSDRQAGRKTE